MARVLIELLAEDPFDYLVSVLVIVGSIVLHELGHAFAADRQGDATPRMLGHFTWNPLVHMGATSLILACTIGIAFGSTPVNRRNFRNRRYGDAIVSFAGPAVNLLLFLFGAVMLGLTWHFAPETALGLRTKELWQTVALYNVALFLFNMIPLPPMDGFSVADGTLGMGEAGPWLRRMHPYPMFAAFLLVMVNAEAFWTVCATATGIVASIVGAVLR